VKKSGILNHRISELVAQMGHGDLLVVADAGLPIPRSVERVDVAITQGLPGFIDVVAAIAQELQVEYLIVAEELDAANPDIVGQLRTLFPGSAIEMTAHGDFKARTKDARAIVRTGECTPYANVILVSGVTF
jgi:D-ribose pyranase